MEISDSFKKIKIVRAYDEREFINLYRNKECLYVRANGNNDNDGLSEQTPFENLEWALNIAQKYNVYKIIVIGELDCKVLDNTRSTFTFAINPDFNNEILITGKQNAKEDEKAVLTTKDKNISVLNCYLNMDNYTMNNLTEGKIRFENIELKNGDIGLWIKGMTVILGNNAIISKNIIGVALDAYSTLILDGGIISNNDRAVNIGNSGTLSMLGGAIKNNGDSENDEGGVRIQQGGLFKMYDGLITENKVSGDGAGVYVEGIATFEINGGKITKNIANNAGGGVIVLSMGIFKQNGGLIIDNEAKIGKNKNIYIQNLAHAHFADPYYNDYIKSIS